jgi:hypothetical protein
MAIQIDPQISARIQAAWAKLSPDQQNRISPMIEKAHRQAVDVARTGIPPSDPSVPHQALLAKTALHDDRDQVASSLPQDVVIALGPDGSIWGTGKYQQLDPGWVESAALWLETLIAGKHAFSTNPATVKIPDNVSIAIAGDWGTGDWKAPAATPSSKVGANMAARNPHITIHLGDVYYSGTSEQEQTKLVDIWPKGSIGSFTLNSNHEMYSGAKPYFDLALGSAVFQKQQGCSYFALENSKWIIVGLDSAYYSNPDNLYMNGSLVGSDGSSVQIDFLKAQVAKGKKIIVLTHHNGLAEDGSATNALWQQVMTAFPPGQGPAYWYWGHLHAGTAYTAYEPSKILPRCCGHGALPWGYAKELDKYPIDQPVKNPFVVWFEKRKAGDPETPERVWNGFSVLQLRDAEIQETFYDENGGVAWQSGAAASATVS